jgi:3-deoxy-7-phosphoheptulonate synthase
LLIEVHHKPAEAMSDGSQSITPDAFGDMMRQMRRLAEALDRRLP